MGNSEATENDEAAAHAREVREAVQDLAERGTYVEAAFMGRMLAARREIEKALAEGRSPGIDCTHMDDEEFMALIHASAVPDSQA